MVSIVESSQSDSNWNNRLINSNYATIYQTKEIAIIYSKQNLIPKYITFLNNNGKIIAQLLAFESIRFEKKKFLSKFLVNFPNIKKSSYTWSYGPIIFDTKYSTEIFVQLGKFLKEKNCKVSGVTHPFLQNDVYKIGNNFTLKPWSTFIVDLSKSKNELYKNIRKNSGRKNIERSIERGVIVEQINDTSLHDYYQLKNETIDESGIGIKVSFSDLQERWNLLKPLGYSGFISKYNDKVIGGLFFSYMNNHIIEGGLLRSKYDTDKKLYSQDLIKWKIIEWGLTYKMNYYNLAGFNPTPLNQKEQGILKYKQKWGGIKQNYMIINR